MDRTKDPSYLSGPSVRDVRRSCVEEQYPTLVRNNRLRASDLARLRGEVSTFGHKPLVSILMPLLEPESRRLERTLDSVVRQIYPHWEVCICGDGSTGGHTKDLLSTYERLDWRVAVRYLAHNAGMVELSNAARSAAGGEFVCLLGQGGDELASDALFEIVKLLQEHPEADLIYTDEDAIDEEGNRFEPRFKPGWSPDLLLSTNYISCSGVYRRSLLEELDGFREGFEGCHDYDLLLRLTERTDRIFHVPKVLYHRRKAAGPLALGGDGHVRDRTRRALSEALQRRGLGGSVEDGLLPGTFRARPKIKGEPKVSIIIPTRDNVSLLKNGVESIERLTSYPNYEILIVDNDSSEPATLEYLASTPHRVIPFREAFNYSRINNFAVSHAEGEYVLLLNDDTEVISGEWLEAMLEHAQRPEVGAVGARLLYPDGRVQHAGAVTGIGVLGPGVCTHAYQFYPSASPGHMGTLSSTCNYTVVTAACVLLRRSVYEEAGGLDEENLPVSFNDVDLCLRIRELGYRVVYTPYAELYHYESASRGYKGNPAESLYMRERWGEALDADPYYNPNFSRGSGDFNLRADLLRPRVIRRERSPEDPASSFKSPLTASPEELKELIWNRQRTARDSYRTVLVPKREGASVRIAALEGLRQGEAVGPRGDEQPQGASSGPVHDHRARGAGVRADQLIWLFGSPRTGSTWLSKMMAELENQERWNEPYVGLLFGSFLHERLGGAPKLLGNPNFILSERHRDVWLGSIRKFVLQGSAARYPDLGEDRYLVVKEPNGSVGASLLMEALPESRMVFLMRDPRDVVASRLDAVKEGGWTGQERDLSTAEELEAFTQHLAEDYLRSVSQVREAYEGHPPGRKAFVRYEDLKRDTVGTLGAMYADLGMVFDRAWLEAAAAKHGWEAIPEEEKGEGRFYRKASPGSWRDDLTPEQAAIIERVTAPVLREYYPDGAAAHTL